MLKAKNILDQYQAVFDALQDSKNELRFGRGAVSISAIAQQYFCEKELELDYEHPQEPTREMVAGRDGHETITTLAVPVTKEEAIKDAIKKRQKAICIYEFGVAWNYKGVPILGRVDEVWFRSGYVDLITERKFTNSLHPYRSHHIQARQYCLGLDGLGFDTSSTVYDIMTFKRECYNCIKLIDRSCPIFKRDRDEYKCKHGEVKVFSHPFSKEQAIEELEWSLGFWLKQREAIPSRNPAKCNACRQRNNCEFSLM